MINVTVEAEYRMSTLPAPTPDVAQSIIAAAREITHIDQAKGKTPLSLGVRDSSITVEVKVKSKDDRNSLSMKF